VADDDPLFLASRKYHSCFIIHGFQGERYDNFIDHVIPQVGFQPLEIGNNLEFILGDRVNRLPVSVYKTKKDIAEPWSGTDYFSNLYGPVIGSGNQKEALVSAVESYFSQNKSEDKATGCQRRGGGGQENRDEKRSYHYNREGVCADNQHEGGGEASLQ